MNFQNDYENCVQRIEKCETQTLALQEKNKALAEAIRILTERNERQSLEIISLQAELVELS